MAQENATTETVYNKLSNSMMFRLIFGTAMASAIILGGGSLLENLLGETEPKVSQNENTVSSASVTQSSQEEVIFKNGFAVEEDKNLFSASFEEVSAPPKAKAEN